MWKNQGHRLGTTTWCSCYSDTLLSYLQEEAGNNWCKQKFLIRYTIVCHIQKKHVLNLRKYNTLWECSGKKATRNRNKNHSSVWNWQNEIKFILLDCWQNFSCICYFWPGWYAEFLFDLFYQRRICWHSNTLYYLWWWT